MRNISFLMLFFFFANDFFAQEKTSYRLINNGTADPTLIEKALGSGSFDSIRFVKNNRMIPVVGTQFVVELFSGQYLFDEYGKQISPHNIMDETKAPKIRFKLNKNNHLEIEK